MLRTNSILTTIFVATGIAVASLAGGCSGSSYNCEASKCSADPKPSQASIDTCKEDIKKAECSTAFDCLASKQKCTSDNKTDSSGSIQAIQDCAQQVAKAIQAGCKTLGGVSPTPTPTGDAGH